MGKCKLSHFYPPIDGCPASFGAGITNKGNKLMCVRINYGDPNKERGEIVKKEEQILKS